MMRVRLGVLPSIRLLGVNGSLLCGVEENRLLQMQGRFNGQLSAQANWGRVPVFPIVARSGGVRMGIRAFGVEKSWSELFTSHP